MKWRRLETRREKRERILRESQAREAAVRRAEEEAAKRSERAKTYWTAFQRRNENPQAYEAWERVLREFLATATAPHREFWITLQRFKDAVPADSGPLLTFLELDEWFHGSGYGKADAIRVLKRLDLSEPEKDRLRQVVLNVVDVRDRREFRHYCALARKVDSPGLRAALQERLAHADRNVRRRARWVLDACERNDERK